MQKQLKKTAVAFHKVPVEKNVLNKINKKITIYLRAVTALFAHKGQIKEASQYTNYSIFYRT